VFGLIKMLWKFAWLTVFILGVRRALEIVQGWVNGVIDNIEEGEPGPTERALVRLHQALHTRQSHRGDGSLSALKSEAAEPSAVAS
jgi:hypothetical protein